MPISFHSIAIAPCLQTLPAVGATLDKGKTHCSATGIDPEAMLASSLAADMKPLHFQIRAVLYYSLGAIDGLRSGRFGPPPPSPPADWDGLRAEVSEAAAAIAAIGPEEADELSRREVIFSAGPRRRHFTAEDFVLSLSLPNLHFHAATTYAILRSKGVPLEKRDYLGRLLGRTPPTEDQVDRT